MDEQAMLDWVGPMLEAMKADGIHLSDYKHYLDEESGEGLHVWRFKATVPTRKEVVQKHLEFISGDDGQPDPCFTAYLGEIYVFCPYCA